MTDTNTFPPASVGVDGDTSGAFAFRIGDLDCVSLSDGHIPTPTWLLAPETPPDVLQAFLMACGESPVLCDVPLSCLLVRLKEPSRTILVDAGMGQQRAAPGAAPATVGRLLESLSAAGVAPDQVDTVLVSHIHPDHVGGLFDADDRAVFANASYFVAETERAFWAETTPDLGGTLMLPPRRVEIARIAHRFLALAGEKLRVFHAGEDPVPGVGSMLLPGHTPGQVGFVFRSRGDALFYTADAAGHPFISLQRPEWRFSFDADSPQAVETRRMLVAHLRETGWRNFTPHFPHPAVGRIGDHTGRPVWLAGV